VTINIINNQSKHCSRKEDNEGTKEVLTTRYYELVETPTGMITTATKKKRALVSPEGLFPPAPPNNVERTPTRGKSPCIRWKRTLGGQEKWEKNNEISATD